MTTRATLYRICAYIVYNRVSSSPSPLRKFAENCSRSISIHWKHAHSQHLIDRQLTTIDNQSQIIFHVKVDCLTFGTFRHSFSDAFPAARDAHDSATRHRPTYRAPASASPSLRCRRTRPMRGKADATHARADRGTSREIGKKATLSALGAIARGHMPIWRKVPRNWGAPHQCTRIASLHPRCIPNNRMQSEKVIFIS